jgi:hypothetical protein
MKTFKKYLNEQHGIGVGTPEVNSVEDVALVFTIYMILKF